jgi:hypothetical protein
MAIRNSFSVNYVIALQERHHLSLQDRNAWNPLDNPEHNKFKKKYQQFCEVVDGASPESYLKSRIENLFGGVNGYYKPELSRSSFPKRRAELQRLRAQVCAQHSTPVSSNSESTPSVAEQTTEAEPKAVGKTKRSKRSTSNRTSRQNLVSGAVRPDAHTDAQYAMLSSIFSPAEVEKIKLALQNSKLHFYFHFSQSRGVQLFKWSNSLKRRQSDTCRFEQDLLSR